MLSIEAEMVLLTVGVQYLLMRKMNPAVWGRGQNKLNLSHTGYTKRKMYLMNRITSTLCDGSASELSNYVDQQTSEYNLYLKDKSVHRNLLIYTYIFGNISGILLHWSSEISSERLMRLWRVTVHHGQCLAYREIEVLQLRLLS